MQHDLYIRLLSCINSCSLSGMQMMNAAMSPISGATLDPALYSEGAAQKDRAAKLLRRLRSHYEKPANPEPTADTPSAFDLARMFSHAEAIPAEICICQKMYDTGETGVFHIDQWLAMLNWPNDWYKSQYHNPTSGTKLARKIKYRVEQNCPASIHYPSLIADDMYGGRPVFTSLDEEKQEENREGSEELLWLDTNLAEKRKRFEYRGADAGAGNTDALQRQREEGNFNNPTAIDRKEADVQETLNLDIAVAHASRVERRALSRIRKEEPSPWDTLVWRNKARIRAKEEQARRNLWFICKREGWTDDPEKLADIKRRVEESGYAATLKVIREGFRALAVA